MTDLHLDHFLYLLHSCTHFYQSRGLPLAQGPWRYFYKSVWGVHATTLYGDYFLLQDCTRAHAHATKLYGGFYFISEFEGFCLFLLQDCTGHTTRLHGGRRLKIEVLLPIFWLPDCTGATNLMMEAFISSRKPIFSIILYTYYTLAFTAT